MPLQERQVGCNKTLEGLDVREMADARELNQLGFGYRLLCSTAESGIVAQLRPYLRRCDRAAQGGAITLPDN